jgi:hypothetical protein
MFRSLLTGGCLALVALTASEAWSVTIDTVSVGYANNAGQTLPFSVNFPLVGAVDHTYRIGTTEVTNAQYAEFLNAKAASDPLALYDANMASDTRGGIVRSGSSGSYSYAVKPDMGNKPVNYVTQFDAMRFSNWLNNGQGAGSTENGAYTLLGGTPTPNNSLSITRTGNAQWFLPTYDEWYKAAYYQPATAGGDSDNYWYIATRSNDTPTQAILDVHGDVTNPGVNVVNFGSGNADIGGPATVGGAGPLSASFFGTFDQSGNVGEITQTVFAWPYTGGGSFVDPGPILQLGAWSQSSPYDGFRVAAVPEPGSLALAAMGWIAICVAAHRRRRQSA